MVIKKNKEVVSLCHYIEDEINEIKETIDTLSLDDETDLLFQIGYITDCIDNIEKYISQLQSKFTTTDKFFLKTTTTMEELLDDRKLDELQKKVLELLKYVYN